MKHGGDLAEAAEAHPAGTRPGLPWLDLSTGINPHPWPIPDTLRAGDWTRLPSRRDMDALLAAARRAYRVPDGTAIVAAPGTQALIQWLPRLAAPGPVAILGPTYAEHETAWRLCGAAVFSAATPDEVSAGCRHVVVVNPNNPDGRILARRDLLRLADRCGAAGGWLVVDESFADVAPECSVVEAAGAAPVVVLRSFGKVFGLAGLRLGFAIASGPVAARIAAALGPWPVAAPALAVGTLALADAGWMAATRVRLAVERAALDRVLTAGGLAVTGGTDLFRLARVPEAHARHAALAEAGIWVRRFAWSADLLRFGLPPDAASRERLAAALA